MEKTGCLLVSFDFSNGKDKAVMLVDNKAPNKDVAIMLSLIVRMFLMIYLWFVVRLLVSLWV